MDQVKTRLAVVIPKTESSKPHKTADIRNFFASTTAPRRVPSLSSPASSPTTITEKKKKSVKDNTSKRPMAQLMLDLSNRPTTQMCQECGMSFVIGVEEDMSLHKKHHRRVVDGVEWPMSTMEESEGTCRVVWRSSWSEMEEEKIVKVNLEPRQLKRSGYKAKVEQILEMVNRSLDAQDLTADQLASSVLYLYLGKHSSSDNSKLPRSKKRRLNSSSGGFGKPDDKKEEKKKKKKKVVVKAMCVAARIEQGYQIVRGPDSAAGEEQLDDGELLRFGETTCELFCSPKPEAALVGIHRIWSSPPSRRMGYARRLLDAVADTFIYGMPIMGLKARREAVAFSQPSESGMRLAADWFQTVLFKIFMD
ncbi:hypothetical protein PCASD_13517 [Puccinia coronata f. sp. avenae]|uniref:N-acetyltransferase ECO1 n=2 Tax=Puccinia coronata f. sp. avenae TaxID=200324 RepID=A0A2N5U055_9BASI|nr:hypothetical protein PCASD_13517 [Puccinia coronata f. sp. avenae]